MIVPAARGLTGGKDRGALTAGALLGNRHRWVRCEGPASMHEADSLPLQRESHIP